MKNRSYKVDINHINSGVEGGDNGVIEESEFGDTKGNGNKMTGKSDLQDSSIGEGMDISIQGANGHVKQTAGSAKDNNNGGGMVKEPTTVNNKSRRSSSTQPAVVSGLTKREPSDMSIGKGMDISIRGEEDDEDQHIERDDEKSIEKMKEGDGDSNTLDGGVIEKKKKAASGDEDDISYDANGKDVPEVLQDPYDDIIVEDCCWEICYKVCPCCIGDLDSPFWQLWFKHRLQVSR